MSKLAAIGVKLVFDPAGTPVEIAQLLDVSGPGISTDTIDVTTHDSAGAHREFLAGLVDAGEINLDMVFDHEASQSTPAGTLGLMESKSKDRTTNTWEIRMKGGTNDTYRRFSGIVTSFNPENPVEGSINASATIKLSGQITDGTV